MKALIDLSAGSAVAQRSALRLSALDSFVSARLCGFHSGAAISSHAS